ncbi:MAG: hypothetical protein F2813_00315 [Actinobacteria bacterium]|uniref:Unannotated protein n=1 Tax=freshwater metagenome TaxID=449393 RepID=A0A6J5Z3L8_9ZZZZ|nr:hypothetical protein [Actinomycetota bacterium]
MPTVPRYQPNVAERPAFRQNVTTQASADDMGAAVGRGLGRVAEGVAVATDALAQLRDLEDSAQAAEADNALSAWSREAMWGDGGYMTLEGRAAVDARSGFENKIEEQRREFGAGLKSAGAQRKYAEVSQGRKSQLLQTVVQHNATATKAWLRDSSDARLDTMQEDAIARSADPKEVDKYLYAGLEELGQRAALEGWDADILANKKAQYISDTRQAVAMRIAIADPLAAMDYLEKHRENLTGPAQASIEDALDERVKVELTKRESAKIIDMIATGEGDIEAQMLAIEDEDVRDLTRKSVTSTLQAQATAEKLKTEALQKQAYDAMVTKGISPFAFPPELQSALGIDGMKSFMSFWETHAAGETPTDDPQVVYDMRIAAATDPKGFAAVNLLDHINDMSPQTLKEMSEKQADIVAANGKDPDGAVVKSAFSIAGDQLEAIGITTVGKKGGDREKVAGRIADFQNALYAEIMGFKAENGKLPTDAETRAMVSELLLPVVIKRPSDKTLDQWFGGGFRRTDGYLFEAGGEVGTLPDGSTIALDVDYAGVPFADRIELERAMEQTMGRKPSPDEVAAKYNQYLTERR